MPSAHSVIKCSPLSYQRIHVPRKDWQYLSSLMYCVMSQGLVQLCLDLAMKLVRASYVLHLLSKLTLKDDPGSKQE